MAKEPKAEVMLFVDEVNIPIGTIDARPQVVQIIRLTDGYDPNAEVAGCNIITEDEQCLFNKGHDGGCSFDREEYNRAEDGLVEHELHFTVLKERTFRGEPFVIDGGGFSGLTAELEEDNKERPVSPPETERQRRFRLMLCAQCGGPDASYMCQRSEDCPDEQGELGEVCHPCLMKHYREDHPA